MTEGAALLLTTTIATAGGIDRSGQFMGVIFEEGGDTGSYAQFSYGVVSAKVSADPLLGGQVTTGDPL
ncbi:hypothetical protein N9Q54_00410 [Octadecabacter sp.]|nr:hypothetical protein [Octadecabacter sp.]